MKIDNVPALCSAQNIATREQFHVALEHVNVSTKRENITTEEAKKIITKAEALRAWSSYDRRLSDEEKREANRAMTRVMRMVAELADKEQPNSALGGVGGRTPGPHAWLMRVMGLNRSAANSVRSLVTNEKLYTSLIESGKHWRSALTESYKGRYGLSTFSQFMSDYPPIRTALSITEKRIGKELTRIKEAKAWLAAYEGALLQRNAKLKQSRQKSVGKRHTSRNSTRP